MSRLQSAKDMLATMSQKLRATVAVLLVAGAAYLLAKVFVGHDVKVFLPLWFVAVLVALAVRFGIAVGVIGSLLSAAIFATTLFSPVGSLWISDHAARQNLAWMVLGGVALSFLFAPSDSARRKS
jgi:K+-sensing histidine kinase KdpD